MSNPGLDAVNITADDVLAPKRQREIEQLAAQARRVPPDEGRRRDSVRSRLGLERAVSALPRRAPTRSTTRRCSSSAFASRRAPGLPRIYGVDYDLDVNLASVMVWALTHGQPELADGRSVAEREAPGRGGQHDEARDGGRDRRAHSTLPRADSAHGIYLAALRVGADTSYPGANVAGAMVRAESQDRVEHPARDRLADGPCARDHRRRTRADPARAARARPGRPRRTTDGLETRLR